MGMTMTEKILARHVGRDQVQAGDLLVSQVDLVLANDITGPPAINEFEKCGAKGVFSSVTAIRAPSMRKPVMRMANNKPCMMASSRLVTKPSGRMR